MEERSSVGTVFSILGIICSSIGFFICWWLGFIGFLFGLIGLCGSKATAGVCIGLSIIEIIISLVILGSLGIL